MKCHESPSRWRSIKVGNNQARQLGAFSIMHLRRVCTESLTTTTTMHYEQKKNSAAQPTKQNSRKANQPKSQPNQQSNKQPNRSFHALQASFPSPSVPRCQGYFFALSKTRKKKKETKGSAPDLCVVVSCVAHPSLCRGARNNSIGFRSPVLHSIGASSRSATCT
jgi:hypothetical protein